MVYRCQVEKASSKKNSETSFSNLSELLKKKVDESPDSEHIRFRQGGTIISATRFETASQAAGCAAFLQSHGIGPNDRVGIVSEKSHRMLFAFFGVFSRGAVAVPVAEELPAAEQEFIFSDADLKLILSSDKFIDKVRKAAPGIPVHQIQTALRTPGEEYSVSSAAPDDAACIIYTSGSTGRPKGVILTHQNFLANALSVCSLIEASSKDAILSILPYWHSYALTVELFAVLTMGCVLAIPNDKRDFLFCMSSYNPTIILIVPRIAEMLRKNIERSIEKLPPFNRKLFLKAFNNSKRVCTDDPSLKGNWLQRFLRRYYLKKIFLPIKNGIGTQFRFFVSGGAPIEKDHQVFFKRIGIPVLQGYGLTESTPVISAAGPGDHRLGSSGHLADWLFPENGGDFTFEGPDGKQSKDIKGELLVRGECVMKGYWNRDSETAKALRNGWLHTGDIGFIDRDGFLFLSGRSTNLVCLAGGEKFHPEPIEEKLKMSPWIGNCVMLGEGCKNSYAIICPEEETTKGMNPQEIRDLVEKDIKKLLSGSPSHWIPKDFIIVKPFSTEAGLLTQTMKIKRKSILKKHALVIEGLYVRNGETLR